MTWEQMQEVVANCLDFCEMYHRLPYFYITGGDPILRPDFWQLLELVKAKNIPFTIMGNPFHLIDEVCQRLKSYRCQKYQRISVPEDTMEQKWLLRSLMNVRSPHLLPDKFLAEQDKYLREELARKGIVDIADLTPVAAGIYLWQGDITRLHCDAIVNAANSGMTECYIPCHKCIDNCIHTYAGMQLRQECAAIMRKQGQEEKTGRAKITGAYNLPCKYILHTVGPIIDRTLTQQDEDELASCYRSCLELVKNKDYFVLTTNVDHCFQKAGFDKKRLFYTQGGYGLFQCSEPCCQEPFDNEGVVNAMMQQQRDMRVPSALLPVCPLVASL